MVGAHNNEDFDSAKLVLNGMGTKVIRCGDIGTGGVAKIVNNLILGINMIAASEGIALGEKLGIDPKILSNILGISTSGSWVINASNPRPGVIAGAPASNNYDGGF